MEDRDTKKLLNTLEGIDGTLKRIEQTLSAEKQHGVIKNAVFHLLRKMLNSEIVCNQ